ncbi:fatty acid desaturase [Rufibacter sp. DG15C]|uniref:fatty acid desaturase n=1 Tax=Rufibacter sp. DG15C TaxID=1379909 RepID=UPI00078B7D96|nr:fatty acid desaturase [Rufibacter sp. DG15C]
MLKPKTQSYTGIIIALLILTAWASLLWFLLHWEVSFASPLTYVAVLVMTHLYTGLFITAHDAMHGVVAPGNKRLNTLIGTVTAGLFAFNYYGRLYPKHHLHHQHVATEEDPDYHGGNFFLWFLSFARQYITILQVLLMAGTYNLLQVWFPVENIILFWMAPAVLATFQLFYFGTYLPHRGEHEPNNKHKSSTQGRNHLWAFISCYFFGYHYEHHDKPYLPWWKLYQEKDRLSGNSNQ